ncbi:MAG: hypothetical protein AUJ92_14980 [Armatimonadetes bacterium CG2_30_59_28]|nr:nucleotidyltransferase domain-containing protein [Armatimonadota bacterium]OIO92058.1 MAG: hypothetical protein AUJ92_14980 [Armatimonadetes bacterium CG2_30_59_28]PIU60378.1 MAG: hypothetical protein COS85_24855 [Armatimonadetes bacterium CG07_land_8_20_14_0_80_59_28]PIX38770.1 MAG: hypothetical protein COZ56_19620 [Armatimonadetes bacterium CG_4_8_14_3_um_filter_58_9]PIY49213.1 MAG: hypothetical protein COZ05_00945 [Armatimonadetes bacterium CG_4_10_14_3_um_filter_59_10]
MTATEITTVAQRFRDALTENGISVSAIYLFGSHLNGVPHRGSDIDLCVVSKCLGDDDFEDMVIINQIGKKVAAEIEAFPVSEEESKAPLDPFIAHALSKGKRIL